MRKVLFISMLFLSINALAFGNDSIGQLQREMKVVQEKLYNSDKQIKAIKWENTSLKTTVSQQANAIDSLKQLLTQGASEMASQKSELQNQKKANDANYSAISSKYNKVIVVAIICLVVLLLVGSIIILRLQKRILYSRKAFNSLQSQHKKIEEYQLNTDKRILELENARLTLDKGIKSTTKKLDVKPDHSLALKIANEITRVETNLSRMDSSIKGYRQLQASVKRIKDNLLANGYEIVEMLGKPYNQGMMVEANFIPDETLKEDEQIITGIVKPQVNYKGVMIQVAQITVSQN